MPSILDTSLPVERDDAAESMPKHEPDGVTVGGSSAGLDRPLSAG